MKRRRTIWLWLSPTTSCCSAVLSSTAPVGGAPGLCRGSGASTIAMTRTSSVAEPDARIEHGVRDVRQQVERDGEDRDDDEERHDGVRVLGLQPFAEQPAHRVPLEDR